MARTIAEIKKTMTDAFMEESAVREMYGLKTGDTFGGSFSKVSLENILFYIVAACCHFMEVLLHLLQPLIIRRTHPYTPHAAIR